MNAGATGKFRRALTYFVHEALPFILVGFLIVLLSSWTASLVEKHAKQDCAVGGDRLGLGTTP